MHAQQIKAFIDAMAASDLAELEASKDGWTLRLVRGGGARPAAAASTVAPAAAVPADAAREQCAPLSGVLFQQPAPGEPPYAPPGQAVKAGQTLCVIEAMKVFNEVQAERDGVIDAWLVESGHEVDSGQAIVRFR